MQPKELLEQIRPIWMASVSLRLAQVEGVRENFSLQLSQFYDALEQAVGSDDVTLLDPVLQRWGEARTQTDLEDPENSLTPVLNQLLALTYETVRTRLAPTEALELIGSVLPAYTYALEYAAAHETQLHVRHVAVELGKAKSLLERLERSKSDFIAVAAHELKTPLTLIDGYASMLNEMLPDAKSQMNYIEMYIKGIHAGTRRLREIVDDMIDVSMIDNNLLTITFQPVWISRILKLVQREVAHILIDRNLHLAISDFPGGNEMTYGDGERLYQAFRNVVANAVKYTPDGGSITVDGRTLPGFVEVTVTDTGIGIDPEDHTRIFEKFGRLGDVALHSSGKTKFKGGGPGLGLPIAKGIIEAHGGAIWVESEGHDEARCPGATFHVLLPLRNMPPDDRAARLFRSQAESSD
jgi:signal transduction histidine kinase